MRKLLSLLVVVVVACGTRPAATTTPSPAITPSPSPSTSPAPSTAACRVPVWGTQGAGFIDYPGGTFAADARAQGGETYLASAARWLPVFRQQVAPDASAYARMTDAQVNGQPSQAVHIVETATGGDRVLVDNSDLDMPVWRQDGIYVVHHAVGTDASRGLARLDPATGDQTVIPVPNVYLSRGWEVRGSAAWATGFEQGENPSDGFATDLLESYDLGTGAITTWWHDSAHPIVFLGSTPDGLPVVQIRTFSGSGTNVSISHDEAAVLASQDTVQRVLVQADHQLNFEDVSVDDHGLWLAGLQGIFLAPPGQPATQLSGYQRAMGFAGPCD